MSLLYVSPGAEASFHGWFDVGYVGVGVAVVLAARRIGGFSRWRWPYVTALLSMLAAALCSGAGSVWAVPAPVRAVMACVSGTGFGLLCLLNAESLVRLRLLRIVLYLAANSAMASVFLWALYTTRQFSLVRVTRLSFSFMAAGLLLVLFPSSWGAAVSAYCVALAFSLFTFCTAVLLYAMGQSTGVPIAPLIGGLSVTQLAIMAGDLFARSLPSSLPAVSTVVAVFVVVLSLGLLFLERDFTSRWSRGVILEAEMPMEEDPRERLEDRCRNMADNFGLTEREGSVLVLLVGPQTNRAIAAELGITPGTLKTHVRHIYEKTGVHSREELGELGGWCRGGGRGAMGGTCSSGFRVRSVAAPVEP